MFDKDRRDAELIMNNLREQRETERNEKTKKSSDKVCAREILLTGV